MINRNVCFYMANLGSEVGRVLRWKKLGDIKEAQSSGERALKIIDAVLSLPEAKGGEKEIRTLREIINDRISDGHKFLVPDNQIISYFTPFAVRVMNLVSNNK